MELKNVTTMIGYDEDMNEVLKLSGVSLQSIDAISNVTKAMNGFGATVAEFTSTIEYTLSLLAKSLQITDVNHQSTNLLRPETDAITDNPNRKIEYEILEPISDGYIIPIISDNVFLKGEQLHDY